MTSRYQVSHDQQLLYNAIRRLILQSDLDKSHEFLHGGRLRKCISAKEDIWRSGLTKEEQKVVIF